MLQRLLGQDSQRQTTDSSTSPRNSSTPLITSDQRQQLQELNTAPLGHEHQPEKRRLVRLGRNNETSAHMAAPTTGATPQTAATAVNELHAPAPSKLERKTPAQPLPLSPSRHPYQHAAAAASPSRLLSQSPRLHSPASSEIFERNVQESVPISTLGGEMTPAHIPTHVMTEDAIPPALEASVEAITSEELTPDEVEIVTSTAHQPAGASVLDPSASHGDLQSLHSPASTLPPPTLQSFASEHSDGTSSLQQSGLLPGADDETASNYAQLDPNDVRRLSFISFKDIVQSEHQQAAAASHSSEAGTSLPSVLAGTSLPERTASPALRSPTRSMGGSGIATPPTASSAGFVAMGNSVEQSPVRSGTQQPSQQQQHGELTIETLGQALRKTASRDLGGVRSAGMSPTSMDGSAPRSRTNT